MMKRKQGKAAKASLRRQEQKLHRQEEILEAAFEVFAASGYEAARIDDVARKAGIAKGTIYLYFRDKERLFQAVVRTLIPKFDVLVETLPGTPCGPAQGTAIADVHERGREREGSLHRSHAGCRKRQIPPACRDLPSGN